MVEFGHLSFLTLDVGTVLLETIGEILAAQFTVVKVLLGFRKDTSSHLELGAHRLQQKTLVMIDASMAREHIALMEIRACLAEIAMFHRRKWQSVLVTTKGTNFHWCNEILRPPEYHFNT